MDMNNFRAARIVLTENAPDVAPGGQQQVQVEGGWVHILGDNNEGSTQVHTLPASAVYEISWRWPYSPENRTP